MTNDLHRFLATAPAPWTLDACGVFGNGQAMPALLHRFAYNRTDERPSVLVIGDLAGKTHGDTIAHAIADAVSGNDRTAILSAAPAPVQPGAPVHAQSYPPDGGYFDHQSNPESRYLWRWVNYLAPDLLVELRTGESNELRVSEEQYAALANTPYETGFEDDSLPSALSRGKGDGVGEIPCLRITAPENTLADRLAHLISSLERSPIPRSRARRSLAARQERKPGEVAGLLTNAYGHTLDPVVYTQGVAVSGRLLAAESGYAHDDTIQDVIRLVEPVVSNPKPFFDTDPDGAALAGLTWAYDLARLTDDPRYANLAVAAAQRFETAARGAPPPPADPDYRVEDVFFTAAVLGRAIGLTKQESYSTLLSGYVEDCIHSGVQREDGLFDHCMGSRFPWGRGNGFAALGMAEALTWIPQTNRVREKLASAHRTHLRALIEHSAPSGMQRQLTDLKGSYEELSATCMAGIAIARGLRLGWLDQSFAPGLKDTWNAVNERIDNSGSLVDVCAGTGPQSSVQEYLDRPAISGLDDRGGAMALWFALEMAWLDLNRTSAQAQESSCA